MGHLRHRMSKHIRQCSQRTKRISGGNEIQMDANSHRNLIHFEACFINEVAKPVDLWAEVVQHASETGRFYVPFSDSGDILGASDTLDDAMSIQDVMVICDVKRKLSWAKIPRDVTDVFDFSCMMFSQPSAMWVGIVLALQLQDISRSLENG